MSDDKRSHLNVAKKIYARRAVLGVSQAQVAKAAGSSQTLISELENMEGNPTIRTLDRIARSLGMVIVLRPRRKAKVSSGDASR